MSNVIEHKKCICVEFGDTNNNKVWSYTLYDDGTALTEWGRVGKGLQSKVVSHSKALSKWREKTRPNNKPDKRYTEVKAVGTGSTSGSGSIKNAELKDIARKQITSNNNPIVQQLIDYLVQANAHQILIQSGGKIQYDSSTATFKTPLGVIDPVQVSEARIILAELADLVHRSDYDNSQFNPKLNQYLRLIPHDVGMSRITPQKIFPTITSIQNENTLLDGLDASFAGIVSAPKNKDTNKVAPKVFEVDLFKIVDNDIIKDIKRGIDRTRQKMHSCNHLRIKEVYAIKIKSMEDNFNKDGANVGNVQSLYHGSSAANILSIMRQGLVIPPSSSSHCTGRLLGNGCYFANCSTKSLNYSYGYWGGTHHNRCFLFITDVALGKSYIPNSLSGPFPKPGYDSIYGKANKTGFLKNDEFVVYRTSQANFKYLVEFE